MKTCMNIARDLTGIKYCMFKHANVQTIKSINIRNCLIVSSLIMVGV